VTINLGAGHGHSVLELVAAFEAACGRRITKTLAPRRPGDVACYYADVARAEKLLGWKTKRDLATICADAWRWQRNGGRY
jgi:UDP-glucose 4-epimerase